MKKRKHHPILLSSLVTFNVLYDTIIIEFKIKIINILINYIFLIDSFAHLCYFVNMSDDPLNKLIVDSDELDREKLTSLILGNLGISKSGEIIILPGFVDLTTKSKILSFLLAKKASKVMSLSATDLAATKEIVQRTGLPEGTVNRELFELKEMRLILNEQGYFIPDYAIHLISIEKKTE